MFSGMNANSIHFSARENIILPKKSFSAKNLLKNRGLRRPCKQQSGKSCSGLPDILLHVHTCFMRLHQACFPTIAGVCEGAEGRMTLSFIEVANDVKKVYNFLLKLNGHLFERKALESLYRFGFSAVFGRYCQTFSLVIQIASYNLYRGSNANF
jgi:hypothetical protein